MAKQASFLSPIFPRHNVLWPLVASRLKPGELAHDRHHLERVYVWMLRLAPEAGADADCCGAAALVHDLAFIPKESPERHLGGAKSAELAGDLLRAAGYDATEVDAIAAAVATSSWSRGLAPANAIGVTLQDADRLDAIGAVGLLRNVACGQDMALRKSPDNAGGFYHPEDPFAAGGRPLDDRTWVVDHLPAKLLKLAAGMRLPSAQAEAQRRHAFLLAFRAQLASELGLTLP